jgi:methyltransferase (TIGR00027 family)
MDVTQPVARTAFYCCLLRADDATTPAPICGDTFAARFVDDTVRRDLAPLLAFANPTIGNVVRHRIIDDLAREFVAAHPSGRVLLIGAGFDTRAYRIPGGRWFELDDAPLIAYKESRLPAREAANPLTRIPVVFASEPPERYLAPLAGDDEALVIVEGVSMYLSDTALREFAAAIARLFPRATLVCDLMTPTFANTASASLRRALKDMGAHFGERSGHPRRQIESAGFIAERTFSIPVDMMKARGVAIPRWVLATVLRFFRDGYMVWVFKRFP